MSCLSLWCAPLGLPHQGNVLPCQQAKRGHRSPIINNNNNNNNNNSHKPQRNLQPHEQQQLEREQLQQRLYSRDLRGGGGSFAPTDLALRVLQHEQGLTECCPAFMQGAQGRRHSAACKARREKWLTTRQQQHTITTTKRPQV